MGNGLPAAWRVVEFDVAASVVTLLAKSERIPRFAVFAAGTHFHSRRRGSRWVSDIEIPGSRLDN